MYHSMPVGVIDSIGIIPWGGEIEYMVLDFEMCRVGAVERIGRGAIDVLIYGWVGE